MNGREMLETIDSIIPLDTLGRLLLAAVAGAILGWEREVKNKPAGLRTHMMVALGSAAFLVATLEFLDHYEDREAVKHFDPLRVVAAIIGGIGFLGAGAIIQSTANVRGITTAATIWIASAIGIACGLGLFRLAFASVAIAVVLLVALAWLERLWHGPHQTSADE